MFHRVLVANRGVIACRIIRTLHQLAVQSVAIYTEQDAGSLHVSHASQAFLVPNYLDVAAVLHAARETASEAIHPGYGFLSENAAFAEACQAAGIAFIGPTPEQIRAFGLKDAARRIAVACGAPILPGTELLPSVDLALREADRIGYPVMLKSAGGGGGIGMRLCRHPEELRPAFESVQRLSHSHFQGSGIYLERFVQQARHIEIQIFGDGAGSVVSLGERDCSVQRRNQKVIEETPAPGLSADTRARMSAVAIRVAESIHYRSAGTVEFLYDQETCQFYFLEVNTRLQVEHGVTEEVTGIDLVAWMLRLSASELPPLPALVPSPQGASIQVRIYAESPLQNYQPSSGRITHFAPPPQCRLETWIEAGTEVTPYYDPLLAKVIVRGSNRQEALARLAAALAAMRIDGPETNLPFLRAVVANPNFQAGSVTTGFLTTFRFAPHTIEVLEPGILTTIQDHPGRLGYWAVGVPPSGPMDALSFKLGNQLLGNPPGAPGLECTLSGPALRFVQPAAFVVAGADMQPALDGQPIPLWTIIHAPAGATLRLTNIQGPGARTYLLFAGGLDVPLYLGSAATFTLGNFGGLTGRQLRAGDLLPLPSLPLPEAGRTLTPDRRPQLTRAWQIRVRYGPHGAPDFFTPDDIETIFNTNWQVHHNSSRTGVRLVGPKPQWARADGGEAGLHPSNIHDNAYSIGSIDFTGDMPILLGPDGPSLGGFVCPAVIVEDELWKMGQLSSGDTVHFLRQLDDNPVLVSQRDTKVRQSGDRNLLVEFGDPVLDLHLRFRAHALMTALAGKLPGILDLTPGIRSLQIHYDRHALKRERLLAEIDAALTSEKLLDTAIPTRIVHLPLSWDDPATRLAIERYMTSVRPDAPWCPSNLEFIRRINGLASIDAVHQTVFNARYLVLGLGDVYLGAPVATPLDPRHRLVTTKYNPARTWTPENAVGIGGAYLCVYGMEGPGGYQFVGRTLQMWNTYRATGVFAPGKPWLLRFFDEIRFYPVSAAELLQIRRDFPLGRYPLRIESHTFHLSDYDAFLRHDQTSIAAFRLQQRQAFAEERARWEAAGEFDPAHFAGDPEPAPREHDIPPGCRALRAPTTASVWSLHVEAGKDYDQGMSALILEAMKMEIAVTMPERATVVELFCKPGTLVTAGQPLLLYRTA